MAVIVRSMTATQEQLEHAVSDDWRTAPEVKEPIPEAEQEIPPAGEELPVETAADQEPAEVEENKETPSKHLSGAQRNKLRIQRLSKENEELKSQLEAERGKAKGPAEQARTESQPAAGEPKWDDYLSKGKTLEEFIDARNQWANKNREMAEEKASEAERAKAVYDSYNSSVADFRSEHEDFDDVVGQNLRIPQGVQLAVIEMENGPEVAYHLGKNPDLCNELMEMSPIRSIAKIAVIAESLKKAPSVSPEKKTKVTPPPPIRQVNNVAAQSSVPLDKLPMREFMKIRNQQERERLGH
jgi:hypothetical protein